jgi:hypothetical protein
MNDLTTNSVRNVYAAYMTNGHLNYRAEPDANFDRWLAEHDRQEREKVNLSHEQIETALRRVPEIELSMDEYDALARSVGRALDERLSNVVRPDGSPDA